MRGKRERKRGRSGEYDNVVNAAIKPAAESRACFVSSHLATNDRILHATKRSPDGASSRRASRKRERERERKREKKRGRIAEFNARGILVLWQKHTVIFVKASKRMNPRGVRPTGRLFERREERKGRQRGIKIASARSPKCARKSVSGVPFLFGGHCRN